MRDSNLRIFGASFLDGFSLAGFLTPLKRPGAPTQVFADAAASSVQDGSQSVNPEELERAKRILTSAGFEIRPPRATSVR